MLAAILLCTSVLTSCSFDDQDIDISVLDSEKNTSGEETTKGDPYVMDETIPYKITYTSYGDGTCSVTDIKMNSAYKKGFELVIPEKSDSGETVVAIELKDCFDSAVKRIPTVMTKESFDGFIGSLGELGDPMDAFFVNKLRAYYVLKDISLGTSQELKNELLKSYPIAEYFPVYVLDSSTSGAEAAAIARTFNKFNAEKLAYEEREHIISKLEALSLSKEQIDGLLKQFVAPEYGNFTVYMQAISIPATIERITGGSFKNMYFTNEVVNEEIRLGATYFVAKAEMDAATLTELLRMEFTVYSLATKVPSHWNKELIDIFNNGVLTYGHGAPMFNLMIYSESSPEIMDNEDEFKRYWHYENGTPVSWAIK